MRKTAIAKLLAAAAVGLAAGGAFGEASVPAKADAPAARTKALFFFDTEEYTDPKSSDGIVAIAKMLTEEGVRGHFAFVGYLAKTKKKIDMLSDGVKDAAEMFEAARSANTMMTWIVRLVGFLLMFFGLSMVLKPLSVLADVLPILGNIVEIGTGLVVGVIAFVCALVTIAIAWIFYRPVLGILLLAAAGAAIFLLWKKKQEKKSAVVA